MKSFCVVVFVDIAVIIDDKVRSSKFTETEEKSTGIIVGIDEVGRGPIAGPVSVVALTMDKKNYEEFRKLGEFNDLHNSKALTEKRRNVWYEKILQWQKEGKLDFSYTSVDAKEIDEIGISPAIKKCLVTNLEKLKTPAHAEILLDGSLFAPEKFINQKTIIKGDESESIIALASIAAKVIRDQFMTGLGEKYPEYGLEKHKGYGTAAHMAAVRELGLTEVHRVSFCRNV